MATALLFDSDSSNTTQFVEFTLGIGNLRRNQGQLDLFGISVEQLDTNVAEYAEMLDTIKAILNPRAPRRSKSVRASASTYCQKIAIDLRCVFSACRTLTLTLTLTLIGLWVRHRLKC